MSDLSKRMLDGEICNPHFCKDMSERGDCLCVMSGNRIAKLEAALHKIADRTKRAHPQAQEGEIHHIAITALTNNTQENING